MRQAFSGRPDCDADGIPDACQIEDDEDGELDTNSNGILDACEDGVRSCEDDPEDLALACGDIVLLPEFVRGDANNDGGLSGLPDGLFLLNYQFTEGAATPECMAAADANGNGTVSGLSDGLYCLFYQFSGGSEPPEPFPDCGVDPDGEDGLGCEGENDVCSPSG